jgi:hypothetical protein
MPHNRAQYQMLFLGFGETQLTTHPNHCWKTTKKKQHFLCGARPASKYHLDPARVTLLRTEDVYNIHNSMDLFLYRCLNLTRGGSVILTWEKAVLL